MSDLIGDRALEQAHILYAATDGFDGMSTETLASWLVDFANAELAEQPPCS